MKKTIVLFLIFLLITFIFIINIHDIRSFAKKRLSERTKEIVKEVIFGKDRMKQIKDLQKYKYMNYNVKLLPETQFLKLNFEELYLKNLGNNKGNANNYKAASGHELNSFFLEQYKDQILITTSTGNFFSLNKKHLKDLVNPKFIKINSNLNNNKINILDNLVLKDEIFISYSKFKSEKCYFINILKSKIDNKKLVFENFFKSEKCQQDYGGGKLALYSHEDKNGLLLTVDVFGGSLIDADSRFQAENIAQLDEFIFGKILFIDFASKNYEIFSKGHRTPQGLIVDKDIILSTEHGPRGGDEINLIAKGNNYGWPIASYGEPYYWQKKKQMDDYDYFKSHWENEFIEPIYSFVPSIGISQIIKVPKNFSKEWSNNFLVTSLNGGSIYRILFDKFFSKVVYTEKIYIGKRIRDILYVKDFNIFLVALENNGGSIGILSKYID